MFFTYSSFLLFLTTYFCNFLEKLLNFIFILACFVHSIWPKGPQAFKLKAVYRPGLEAKMSVIRLTELRREPPLIAIKLEGYLTQETLQVLNDSLTDYEQAGFHTVQLLADGLISADRLALQAWHQQISSQLDVQFHTSRLALKHLLEGCHLPVVLNLST